MHLRVTPSRVVARHKHGIVAIAAIAAVTAVVLLPRTRFDCNVITMRDPRTESVQAFNDLLERSRTSPWSVDLLTRDVASAERVAKRMRELDVVADTVTLANYVPGDQEEKIEALAEAAILLDVPPSPETENVEPPVEAQVAALRKLHDLLAADWIARSASPLARSAEQLREHLGAFLARVEREGDAPRALADLQQLLLGNVGPQIERLQKALEPEPITIESLPDDLRRRMLAPDGHARVQVFPEEDLSDTDALIRFVDAVKTVDPEATGVAVNVLAFGRATAHSLRVALILALISITLLLLVLWRRVGETLLALAPLVVGALVTGGSMVVLGMPFNFANVIVLPLLIGIGVDSGIHIVSSSRERALTEDTSIDATTARAVFFSAVTTIGSFGSLALSHHRGIASMGSLLVVGMLIMLACNLILLPALLAMRQHSRSRGTVE
jgi:hypothetical protein